MAKLTYVPDPAPSGHKIPQFGVCEDYHPRKLSSEPGELTLNIGFCVELKIRSWTMSQEQHRAMMSPNAAGVGPQVRCFRLAGLTQKGTKKWTRDKEADMATPPMRNSCILVQPAREAAGRRNSG